MKIKVLLPALLETEEQRRMTKECKKSLVSKVNEIELIEDNKRYPKRVAQAWNALLDPWRGKEYDYLMIVASDTIADPNAVDFMVRCAEENLEAGIISGKVIRNLKRFKEYSGKRAYIARLTRRRKDPACFLLRKGVIEKVGRIDETFPFEFVECDYIYRMQLAGYNYVQPDVILWYHPSFSGTIGNPERRLKQAFRRYVAKWGGDSYNEQFRFPYQNVNLDFTHCNR